MDRKDTIAALVTLSNGSYWAKNKEDKLRRKVQLLKAKKETFDYMYKTLFQKFSKEH